MRTTTLETRCKGADWGRHPCDSTEHYPPRERTCVTCGRTDSGLDYPDCPPYRREFLPALAEAYDRAAVQLGWRAAGCRKWAGVARAEAARLEVAS